MAALKNLALHGALSAAQLVTQFIRPHQLGDVLDPMQDVKHLARWREDWDILGAPIPCFEVAVWPANVIFLHRHGIWQSGRQYALKRRAQVIGPTRLRIIRIVRKYF